MRTVTLVAFSGLLSCAIIGNSSADVILELVGPSQLTVEQGFPHTPTAPLPADGEGVLVWAEMTNTGTETFEAVGPTLVSVVGWSQTVSLWVEFPVVFWDPYAHPDDPIVHALPDYRGILLEPGESFEIPVLEVWGITHYPFEAAPLRTAMTIRELTLEMYLGFGSDPDLQDPDTFITLDREFTVAVVPEPCSLLLLAPGLLAVMRSRRYPPRCT